MRSIAIDGPAGAGKSTLARALAKTLHYIYVDTGALYRAVAYDCIRKGLDTADQKRVVGLLDEIVVQLRYVDGEQRVFLNGEDVTGEIRSPSVSAAASNVSAIPEVRDFLFQLQRDMARHNNVVMDGRDIGTVVLPYADLKIFLTASAEERARRRMLELEERGTPEEYEVLLREIRRRDEKDQNRLIAPLKKAEDAIEVDTTAVDLKGAEALLLDLVKEKLPDALVL